MIPGLRRNSISVLTAIGSCWASGCEFPGYYVSATEPSSSDGGAQVAVAGGGGTSTPAGGGGVAGVAAAAGMSTSQGGVMPSEGGGDQGGALPQAGDSSGGAHGNPEPLLSDDFETGSSQWLEIAGTIWSVGLDPERSTAAYQLAPVFNDFYVAVAKDGKWTDQIIEAKVKVLEFGGTGTGDVVSVMGRFTNIDNYYAAVLRPDGRAAIRASVAGAPPASIKTSPAFGVAANTWYQLRFELVGTTLRLYVDDQLRAEVDDNRIAQGTVALGGSNTAARFDDVRVTQP